MRNLKRVSVNDATKWLLNHSFNKFLIKNFIYVYVFDEVPSHPLPSNIFPITSPSTISLKFHSFCLKAHWIYFYDTSICMCLGPSIGAREPSGYIYAENWLFFSQWLGLGFSDYLPNPWWDWSYTRHVHAVTATVSSYV